MNQLLPQEIQDLLYKIDNTEVTFDYDGRIEGFMSRFSIYATSFTKGELDILFSYCAYPYVTFSHKRQKLWVELEIDL